MFKIDEIRQRAEAGIAAAQVEVKDYVSVLESTVFQHKVLCAALAAIGFVLGFLAGRI